MRIVVGSLQHETNTFTPVKTTYDDFDIAAGSDAIGRIAAAHIFREAGAEIVPTVYANAVPSGRLDAKSFIRFEDELLKRIPSGEKIDGIWLYLHGAMEVEDMGSGEVALLTGIRKKVGYGVPIAVALDFHANNSDELAGLANIICGYRTAPHTDMKETQVRAAELLLECIRMKLLPKPVIVRIPMMVTGDMVITSAEPARSIIGEIEKAERNSGLLTISLFNGQPWVDAPNAGASIVVTAAKDRKIAEQEAKRLGRLFWEAREKFHFEVEALEPYKAVEAAMKAGEEPVFITDSGDNTTAGAPGDNTHLLKAMLAGNIQNALVAGITDSRAVNRCSSLNIGEKASFVLGAELDRTGSETVEIDGIIKKKGNVLGWDGEDAGQAVIVNVSGTGVDVVVTARRCAFISPEIFGSIGVDIRNYRVIAVKQGYLYPELAKVSRRTILALTPGASCEAIERLEFHNIKRPVFPIDRGFVWNP